MVDPAAVLAANIRRLAKRRRLSLNALADVAGVSRSQLFAVLNGTASPTTDWMHRVSLALEVEVWQLIKPTR